MLLPVHLHPALIGEHLPWDVFTESGVLVAGAGMLVADETQFRRLIARPLYRDTQADEPRVPPPGINPLERLETLAKEADALLAPPFSAMMAHQLRELAQALLKVLHSDPEACLGYPRLVMLARPSVHHSLHVLFVAVLLSRRLDFSEDTQLSLAAAALTMNLSVLEVQDRLHHFPHLTDASDHKTITEHPLRTVDLLTEVGVEDTAWLQAVAQHHENTDASGFPAGLNIAAISPMARVLRVADVYCSRISGRHYRPPHSMRTAMKEVFARERPHLDPQISAQLLRSMGLYPPGTLVRLANGESACITRRGRGNVARYATSFLDGRGRLMAPRERSLERQAYVLRGFLAQEPSWPAVNWKNLWGYS